MNRNTRRNFAGSAAIITAAALLLSGCAGSSSSTSSSTPAANSSAASPSASSSASGAPGYGSPAPTAPSNSSTSDLKTATSSLGNIVVDGKGDEPLFLHLGYQGNHYQCLHRSLPRGLANCRSQQRHAKDRGCHREGCNHHQPRWKIAADSQRNAALLLCTRHQTRGCAGPRHQRRLVSFNSGRRDDQVAKCELGQGDGLARTQSR